MNWFKKATESPLQTDIAACIKKGQKYLNENEIELAKAEFQKALQLNAGEVDAHYGLARCYYQSWLKMNRDFDHSGSEIEPTIINSGDIEAFFNSWEKAIAEYTKTVELNSNLDDAHAELGDLLIKKDYKMALEHIHKAVDINPQNALGNWILGQVAFEENNIDLAISRFTTAVRSEPKNPKYWTNLAQAYHAQGNSNEEIHALEKVIEIQPKNTDALYNIGEIYYQNGDFPQAKKYWKEFLQLEPFSSHASRIRNIFSGTKK